MSCDDIGCTPWFGAVRYNSFGFRSYNQYQLPVWPFSLLKLVKAQFASNCYCNVIWPALFLALQSKFVNMHQAEIKFMRALMMRTFVSGSQINNLGLATISGVRYQSFHSCIICCLINVLLVKYAKKPSWWFFIYIFMSYPLFNVSLLIQQTSLLRVLFTLREGTWGVQLKDEHSSLTLPILKRKSDARLRNHLIIAMISFDNRYILHSKYYDFPNWFSSDNVHSCSDAARNFFHSSFSRLK